eukprot:jgi/Mesvir1/16687/Mv15084-RA.1
MRAEKARQCRFRAVQCQEAKSQSTVVTSAHNVLYGQVLYERPCGKQLLTAERMDPRLELIKNSIRTIPNWPKPGVMFRDITTLLLNPAAFKATIDLLVERYKHMKIDTIAGFEARGFIFGPPIALALGCKFVPLRKPKKLPGETIGAEYQLEYGTDRIEMHVGAVNEGDRVLLVDDLVATGGTLGAGIQLMEKVHAQVVECCCVIELPELQVRKRTTHNASQCCRSGPKCSARDRHQVAGVSANSLTVGWGFWGRWGRGGRGGRVPGLVADVDGRPLPVHRLARLGLPELKGQVVVHGEGSLLEPLAASEKRNLVRWALKDEKKRRRPCLTPRAGEAVGGQLNLTKKAHACKDFALKRTCKLLGILTFLHVEVLEYGVEAALGELGLLAEVKRSAAGAGLRRRIEVVEVPLDPTGTHYLACMGGQQNQNWYLYLHTVLLTVVLAMIRSVFPHANIRSEDADGAAFYSPNHRPDIVVLDFEGGGRHLLIDVSVARPLALSHVAGASLTAGYTADRAERAKLLAYGDVGHHRVVPFVLEEFGAMGPLTSAFFKECCRLREDRLDLEGQRAPWSARTWTSYWRQRLSVALTRAMADIMLRRTRADFAVQQGY